MIVLLEVTPWLIAQLADLADRYPHRIAEPQEGNFGIALFSPLPLRNTAVISLCPARLPSRTRLRPMAAGSPWWALIRCRPSAQP